MQGYKSLWYHHNVLTMIEIATGAKLPCSSYPQNLILHFINLFVNIYIYSVLCIYHGFLVPTLTVPHHHSSHLEFRFATAARRHKTDLGERGAVHDQFHKTKEESERERESLKIHKTNAVHSTLPQSST